MLQTIKTLSPARLAVLAGIGLSIAAFFVYLMARLGTPEMAMLYGDLSVTDSSQIVQKLEAMGVPYELQGNGSLILVPGDKALKLRLALAQDGLPAGGSIGYELFDQASGFGTSPAMLDLNRIRALEGELSRTIRTITAIAAARVHLVVPRRELFRREKAQPTASIALKLRGNISLDPGQIRAIQYLVSAAVPGLDPKRVAIVDQKGNLLARGGGGGEEAGDLPVANADEMRRAYERRLARMIEELLESSLGIDSVRAEVTADMDFDRITTTSESYDPDGQVVRSTQTVEEAADTSDPAGDGAVTVAGNLPGSELDPATSDPRSTSQSTRTEETVNFEISKTVRNFVREAGIVRRLSVAVLVDGTYAADGESGTAYTARTPEEMAQIQTLVASAIGFDKARGDSLEVVNMRFAKVPVDMAELQSSLLSDLNIQGYIRIAETLVLFIIAVLTLLLVVRPFVTRLLAVTKEIEKAATEGAGQRLLADQTGGTAALAGPEAATAQVGVGAGAAGVPPVNSALEEMIDMRSVEGRVRASSMKKVAEIIDHHPEESVAILRTWMYEDA